MKASEALKQTQKTLKQAKAASAAKLAKPTRDAKKELKSKLKEIHSLIMDRAKDGFTFCHVFRCDLAEEALQIGGTQHKNTILRSLIRENLEKAGFKVSDHKFSIPWDKSADQEVIELEVSWSTPVKRKKENSSSDEIVKQVRAVIKAWDGKKGHERCWYYPDLFKKIAEITGVELTQEPSLPSRWEFECGCKKYQDEQYCDR